MKGVKVMTVAAIHFVEYGDEYGFDGKVVAKLDTMFMPESFIETEKAAMLDILGDHVVAIEIEEI